jgi:hypothetical protein
LGRPDNGTPLIISSVFAFRVIADGLEDGTLLEVERRK